MFEQSIRSTRRLQVVNNITPADAAARIVSALGAFGLRPTPICELSSIDKRTLAGVLAREAEPSPALLARLEILLAEQASIKFAVLAQAAMLGGDCAAVVRAVLPAVRRLADFLAAEADRHAAADGWPRRLTPQEQAAALESHNIDVAVVEAKEAAERAALDRESAW
jgi:hypothetical protein